MNKYMILNNRETSNRTSFLFEEGYFEAQKLRSNSSTVCERMINTVAHFPTEGFLGLQFDFQSTLSVSGEFFTSPGVTISVADYGWIFCQGLVLGKTPRTVQKKKAPEQMRVYRLRPVSDDPNDNADIPDAEPEEDYYYDSDRRKERKRMSNVREMLRMLADYRAILQILTENTPEAGSGHGTLLIRLRGEMPIRMQAILSMVFPGTFMEDVTGGNLSGADPHLSDRTFYYNISLLLRSLIKMVSGDERRNHEKPETSASTDPDLDQLSNPDPEPMSEPDEDLFYPPEKTDPELSEDTSIDTLDLTVRSYNSLMRRGISTIGELASVSEEELMHIRGLNETCRMEIREKLRQIREHIKKLATSEEILDSLVGLEEVKAQVRKIVAFSKMKKDMLESGMENVSMVLNMEFTGNPGTAKTTVARILADLLFRAGLLTCKKVLEVGRSDLVAKYEGQTAEKVSDVFQRAKGRLLFIDEAYSLVEANQRGYGDEAIDAIVQEMENHREETIVVFAGYPEPMKEFFDRNPGLRSRVPFRISFPDYSAMEMQSIVQMEAKKRGFRIHPDAEDTILSICESVSGDPGAGNGRFCRNLVEYSILEYAERVYGSPETPETEADKTPSAPKTFELLTRDFLGFAVPKKDKKTPIGFIA